jgi:hypothetical protein
MIEWALRRAGLDLTAGLAGGINQAMNSWRAPFVWTSQSAQVADIVAHLSDRERGRFQRMKFTYLLIRGIVALIAIFLLIRGIRELFFGYKPLGIFGFDYCTLLIPVLLIVVWRNRSLRMFLASTEYAIRQGIAAGSLRIHSLGR